MHEGDGKRTEDRPGGGRKTKGGARRRKSSRARGATPADVFDHLLAAQREVLLAVSAALDILEAAVAEAEHGAASAAEAVSTLRKIVDALVALMPPSRQAQSGSAAGGGAGGGRGVRNRIEDILAGIPASAKSQLEVLGALFNLIGGHGAGRSRPGEKPVKVEIGEED